nr:hypothetical protein HK105_003275 [Polyrhizophydium stewartii]
MSPAHPKDKAAARAGVSIAGFSLKPADIATAAAAAVFVGALLGLVLWVASSTSQLLAALGGGSLLHHAARMLGANLDDLPSANGSAGTVPAAAAATPGALPPPPPPHAGPHEHGAGGLLGEQFGLGSFGVASGSLTIMLVGSMLAVLRYVKDYLTESLESLYVVTAHFSSTDESYVWVLSFLADHHISRRARDFSVSSSFYHITGFDDDADDDKDETPEDIRARDALEEPGPVRKRIQYLPAPGRHMFWFNGRLFWLNREESQPSQATRVETKESMTIKTFGFAREPLEQLISEMQRQYLAKDTSKTVLYVARGDWWSRQAAKAIRPLHTLILDDGVAERVIADAREFLASEAWYYERGIPYRRGYLLHGPPGTGKSSFVAVLAGALRLNIYMLNLNSAGMDDSQLVEALNAVPKRCIVLLEDIDALFPKRKLKHAADAAAALSGKGDGGDAAAGKEGDAAAAAAGGGKEGEEQPASRVTLSGLLNALDGVAAATGRILCVTTNRIESIDAALLRPGRIDFTVRLGFATRTQTERLFKHFYSDYGRRVGVLPAAKDGDRNNNAAAGSDVDDAAAKEPHTATAAAAVVATGGGDELAEMAKEFAAKVPEGVFSTAQINGFLIMHKSAPRAALELADAWVAEESARLAEAASSA